MYVPKFTLVRGRANLRSVAVATVNAIALLLVVGCGATPTVAPGAGPMPTPTPTATLALFDEIDIGPGGRPGCLMTLAFYSGTWKAVRGVDPVPSGPDPGNRLTCSFAEGVDGVTVVLRGDARELIRTRSLEAPVGTIGFPMEYGAFGVVPSDLSPGEYKRGMWVTYQGGEAEQVSPGVWRPLYIVPTGRIRCLRRRRFGLRLRLQVPSALSWSLAWRQRFVTRCPLGLSRSPMSMRMWSSRIWRKIGLLIA
jgi:hypothetical protein